MDEIYCEVCSAQFDEHTNTPKVLNCGHTFCTICISKLTDHNPLCPKCRTTILSDIDSFPTNYSLLGISNSERSYQHLESHLKCRCQTLRKRLSEQKSLWFKSKEELCTSLEKIKKIVSSIDEHLIEPDMDEGKTLKEKNELLANLEHEFEKLVMSQKIHFWDKRLNLAFSLRSFESTDGFLCEIYSKLAAGMELFSVYFIEDEVKYGRLSIMDNKILVHALTHKNPPPGGSFVLFNDLKKSLTSEIHSFLKIICSTKGVTQTIVIKMGDSSLTPQFLKLCTGEVGPTYKGCNYKKGPSTEVVQVLKYMKDGIESSGCFDYPVKENPSPNLPQESGAFVASSIDGDFKIHTHGSPISGTFVGRVISPVNLNELISNDFSSEIVDCGFLFIC